MQSWDTANKDDRGVLPLGGYAHWGAPRSMMKPNIIGPTHAVNTEAASDHPGCPFGEPDPALTNQILGVLSGHVEGAIRAGVDMPA